MTLNFDEIELGYKSLAEFYLTLSYYTDELPVDQLLNLPALSEIPKLPKVNLIWKTRVLFELSLLNHWTVIAYFTMFDAWYWFSWIFPTVFTSKYVSNWTQSSLTLTFKLSENYVIWLSINPQSKFYYRVSTGDRLLKYQSFHATCKCWKWTNFVWPSFSCPWKISLD